MKPHVLLITITLVFIAVVQAKATRAECLGPMGKFVAKFVKTKDTCKWESCRMRTAVLFVSATDRLRTCRLHSMGPIERAESGGVTHYVKRWTRTTAAGYVGIFDYRAITTDKKQCRIMYKLQFKVEKDSI